MRSDLFSMNNRSAYKVLPTKKTKTFLDTTIPPDGVDVRKVKVRSFVHIFL